MTEDKIQRLRDAGISEEVIIDMMKRPEEQRSEGYIDPTSPSTTFNQAMTAGSPVQGPETSMSQLGTEVAVMTPDILKYGGGAALGAYGLKKLGQAMGPRPVAPVAPLPTAGSAAHTFETLRSPTGQAPAQPPSIIQRGMDIATKMREAAAARVVPVLPALARGAGAVGGMLYSPSLNTGEAEQLAEYRRRTGQQP